MKNKRKFIFIILFVVLLVVACTLIAIKLVFKPSNNVTSKKNTNNNISIKCSKNSISVGDTINCTLKGYSKNEISMFEGKLKSNSNIEISNIRKNSIWVIGSDDENMQFICDGVKGNFDIVKFNVTALTKGKGKISVGNLKNPLSFTSSKMKTYNINSISYDINIK